MEKNNIENIVKSVLAEQIGVDVADIKPEDLLTEELHLGPAEITDFLAKLEEKGLSVDKIENIQDLTITEICEEIALNS